MKVRLLLLWLLPLTGFGCVEEGWMHASWTRFRGEPAELPAVPAASGMQGPVVVAARRTEFTQASLESAARVDMLGRQLLAANQQLGLKPYFVTIGGPQPELFHVDTSAIYVTEGLVKKCANEAQLAAVLCHELGRMVAVREALTSPAVRSPERPPPHELRVGNDSGGSYGAADQIHLAERLQAERERHPGSAAVPLNPRTLAETYLTRAGHDPKELDAIAPLLAEAGGNRKFQRQLTGTQVGQPAR